MKKEIEHKWLICPNCGSDLVNGVYKEDTKIKSRVTFCDFCGCVISEVHPKDYQDYMKLKEAVIGKEFLVQA